MATTGTKSGLRGALQSSRAVRLAGTKVLVVSLGSAHPPAEFSRMFRTEAGPTASCPQVTHPNAIELRRNYLLPRQLWKHPFVFLGGRMCGFPKNSTDLCIASGSLGAAQHSKSPGICPKSPPPGLT